MTDVVDISKHNIAVNHCFVCDSCVKHHYWLSVSNLFHLSSHTLFRSDILMWNIGLAVKASCKISKTMTIFGLSLTSLSRQPRATSQPRATLSLTHSPPHFPRILRYLLLFTFSLSYLLYLFSLFHPSFSTRIGPLRFQARSHRRRPNLGLVFWVDFVLYVVFT